MFSPLALLYYHHVLPRSNVEKTKEIPALQQEGKWPQPNEDSTTLRKKTLTGSKEFVRKVLPRVKAINNGSKKAKSLSSEEMKLLSSHIFTVVSLDARPPRAKDAKSMTVDYAKTEWLCAEDGISVRSQSKDSVIIQSFDFGHLFIHFGQHHDTKYYIQVKNPICAWPVTPMVGIQSNTI